MQRILSAVDDDACDVEPSPFIVNSEEDSSSDDAEHEHVDIIQDMLTVNSQKMNPHTRKLCLLLKARQIVENNRQWLDNFDRESHQIAIESPQGGFIGTFPLSRSENPKQAFWRLKEFLPSVIAVQVEQAVYHIGNADFWKWVPSAITQGKFGVTFGLRGGAGKGKGKKKKEGKKKPKTGIAQNAMRYVRRQVAGVPRLIENTARSLGGLSKCAQKLMIAISEPFNPEARGACGLTGNTQMSHKVTAYSTGNFSSTGYDIWFNVVGCLANDGVNAYYSAGNLVNTNTILSATNTTAAGIAQQYMLGLPYTVAQLTAGGANGAARVAGRILSIGVRVRFVGRSYDRGGQIMLVHRTNHENTSVIGGASGTAPSLTDAAQWNGASVYPVGDQEYTLAVFPVQTNEFNYTGDDLDQSTTSNMVYPFCRGETETNALKNTVQSVEVGCPIAAIACKTPGGSTAGPDFSFEIITHAEYTGDLARTSSTMSECDPVGHEIVMNAAARLQVALRNNPRLNPGKVMRELAIAGLSSITSVPSGLVRSGFRAMRI